MTEINNNTNPSLTVIPAVPVLRAALIAWCEGDGCADNYETALLARKLSLQHCHFCGAEADPTMALDKPWNEVQLCACMTPDALEAASRAPMMWVGRADAVMPARLENTRTENYVELLRGWQPRVEEMLTKVADGRLSRHTAVYRNTCKCGVEFEVTAGMIASTYKRYNAHILMGRCATCRLPSRSAPLPAPAKAEPSHAAKPTKNKANKKRKNRRDDDVGHFATTLAHGSPKEGNATVGEALTQSGGSDVLQAALSRLRESAA